MQSLFCVFNERNYAFRIVRPQNESRLVCKRVKVARYGLIGRLDRQTVHLESLCVQYVRIGCVPVLIIPIEVAAGDQNFCLLYCAKN